MALKGSNVLTIFGYTVCFAVAAVLIYFGLLPIESIGKSGAAEGSVLTKESSVEVFDMEIPDFNSPPEEEKPPPVLLSDQYPHLYGYGQKPDALITAAPQPDEFPMPPDPSVISIRSVNSFNNGQNCVCGPKHKTQPPQDNAQPTQPVTSDPPIPPS